ncbi:DUF4253 domain-containing protein [Paenibacillus methanolicus]|uniref:Uncharacterized protein DUF4253 n=1 Tax=Paenibacillus methanolicus TaxID=582686 RepID=A0A5S5BYQ8_9BACL|nr:DUF4253 domain-containing protein [Paenibacillus methanolicus]TYP72079.1 uncharacterized protein DUF4253 [Paenibacillus methanolicus]
MGIFDRFKKKEEERDPLRAIIANLDCECRIIHENDAQGVMAKYRQALLEGEKEGYTPLIIVPSETIADHIEMMTSKHDRESILARANELDAAVLLKRLVAESMPDEEEDEEFDLAGEFEIEEAKLNHFVSIPEVLNQSIILAKIPTTKPWEAAAWIPMGGFNACPMPEEQVAVFKYWYEKYGASPGLVTRDVWELVVEHPPGTQEEAEKLAWEHFGFCGDIVWQGVGTVNLLAGSLLDSPYWYFWWD